MLRNVLINRLMAFYVRDCSRYTIYDLSKTPMKQWWFFSDVKIKAFRTELTCGKLYHMEAGAQNSGSQPALRSLQLSASVPNKAAQHGADR